MVLNIDLNVLPSEGHQSEETAAPIDIHYEDMAILSNSGSFSSPIDADAVEDDVLLLPSSAWSPQPRNRPRKKRPVTVLIDDSMATNAGQSGISVDKPVTIFCSGQCLHNAIPLGMIAVDCDLNTDGIYTAKPSSLPMESTLNCPVCLCPLNEPSSTICGHVFCNSCIATAIEKQKKCPTCRKKLNKRNFHRIYLPSL